MIPITAIGAAGSVIGIVGFGLQLSAAIYKFYSQIGDAKESLQAAVDVIDSTAGALEKIYEFLQIEEENLTKEKAYCCSQPLQHRFSHSRNPDQKPRPDINQHCGIRWQGLQGQAAFKERAS